MPNIAPHAARPVALLVPCLLTLPALAADPAIRFTLTPPVLEPHAITLVPQDQPKASLTEAAEINAAAAPAPRFGVADGSWWLTVAPGVATTFGDETSVGLRGSLTTFVADNIQIGGEATLWYFDQPGDNSIGGSIGFVMRWHFVNTGDWTVFADAGIAVMAASEETPRGGTNVNLMPRVGVGVTRLLDDAGTRLEVGLGWHHISNARINGDDENPSRDLPMLHVGLIFPL
jgi:hypothetical protein